MQKLIDKLIQDCRNSVKIKINKNIKQSLDCITKSYNQSSKAPLKAVVASCLCKLEYRTWDTRRHQIQIGGKHSIRSIDTKYISSYMYTLRLYSSPTSYALTRSFEKNEVYDYNYSGSITPGYAKYPFLQIVDFINKKSTRPSQIRDILYYIFNWLMLIRDELSSKMTRMYANVNTRASSTTLEDIEDFLTFMFNSGYCSVLPVITVYTLCTCVFGSRNIKPLKNHTSADSVSSAFADVEGNAVCIEIKDGIPITERMIEMFAIKTEKLSRTHARMILSSVKPSLGKSTHNNIFVGDVTTFCLSTLANAHVTNKNVYRLFMVLLCKNIMNSNDVSQFVKNKIYTRIK